MSRNAPNIMRGIVGALALTLLAVPVGALAYRVQPLIAYLTPSGAGSSTKLVLSNTEATPITLELTPLSVTVGPDGQAERVPEDSDLLVFPPQTIIPPGREQVVQVRYVGAPDIATARIYGVRISQLPVAMSAPTDAQTGTDLKVGVDFISHLIVQSDGMEAALNLGPSERTEDGGLRAPITNAGSGVAIGSDLVWMLTDANGATRRVTNEGAKLDGFGAVMNDGVARTVSFSADAVRGLEGDVSVVVAAP